MTDEKENGIVVSIVPRLPSLPDDDGQPPALRSVYEGCCAHNFYTAVINRNARTLKCGECKAVLDPYDYIAHLAHDGSRLIETRKRYKALVKRVEELMAEERRVKARVRSWRAKEQDA